MKWKFSCTFALHYFKSFGKGDKFGKPRFHFHVFNCVYYIYIIYNILQGLLFALIKIINANNNDTISYVLLRSGSKSDLYVPPLMYINTEWSRKHTSEKNTWSDISIRSKLYINFFLAQIFFLIVYLMDIHHLKFRNDYFWFWIYRNFKYLEQNI